MRLCGRRFRLRFGGGRVRPPWASVAGGGLRFDGRRTQDFHLLLSERRFLAFGENELLFRFDGFAAGFGKALLESFDATRRVDELLPARKEGMAIRTNLKANARLRRARLEGVSAGA